MNNTIDNDIAVLFEEAYLNNQLFEYLVGIGKYLVVFKDFQNYNYNDTHLMLRGIDVYLNKNENINLDVYLNQSLINFLNSNDMLAVNTVLNFLTSYADLSRHRKMRFNIDYDKILPLLKEKLLLIKQKLENEKNGVHHWDSFKNQCFLFELDTGRKIL